MNDLTSVGLPKHILFALDSAPECLQALDVVAELASALKAQLEGVFIEDEALLNLSEFPFSREFSVYTQPQHPLQKNLLEQELRSISNQLKIALEKSADRWQIHWQYRTIRGTLNQTLNQMAQENRLVTFLTTSRGLHRTWGNHLASSEQINQLKASCIVLPRRIVAGKEILLILEPHSDVSELLELAQCFATQSQKPLTVFFSDSTNDAATSGQLKIFSKSNQITLIEFSSQYPLELQPVLNQHKIHMLIASKSNPWLTSHSMSELAELIHAPIYIRG